MVKSTNKFLKYVTGNIETIHDIVQRNLRPRTTFEQMLKRAANQGQYQTYTRDSLKWFRDFAQTHGTTARTVLGSNDSTNIPQVGNLYLFNYDAKHKERLPYWDRYPMIFVLNIYKDGLLGLNMHYFPPNLRAKIMDQLYDYARISDDRIRLKISYSILKAGLSYPGFRHGVKRYLAKQLRSDFTIIDSDHWNLALFLPNVARWAKGSEQQVWRDARRVWNG